MHLNSVLQIPIMLTVCCGIYLKLSQPLSERVPSPGCIDSSSLFPNAVFNHLNNTNSDHMYDHAMKKKGCVGTS